MIIKKRLFVPVNQEARNVNAVLIEDTGEEYPVFLEALLNTVYFPMLLESGYTLTSLPYGFTKDGVTLDQLPMEDYNPSPVEMDEMFASIGVKLPYDEIKKHLNIEEAVGLSTPETAYTINTREEFIEYLEGIDKVELDLDFKPINYFVAPSARFTIDEWQSKDNIRYVQILDERRNMSLKKFRSLVEWLQYMNLLGTNPSPHDVLDAYYSWGFDGLQFTTINKRRETTALRLRSNNNVSVPIVRKTQGFVDGAGNLLTPANERDVIWSLPNKDPEYLQELIRGLGMNDTVVAEFRCNAMQDITILEGTQFNIRYTLDTLIMQAKSYTSLRVKSPVDAGSYVDLSLALPKNAEKLIVHCTLWALARMLFNLRKLNVKTSSYDALHVVGANPNTALNYILAKNGMDKERKFTVGEEENVTVPAYEVEAFLAGQSIPEASKALLEDIIEGVFCIDNIGRGRSMEASFDVTSVYKELYALHHVMGISLEEIYNKFRVITDKDMVVTFSNGEYQHHVDVSPMRWAYNGYKQDVMSYDVQCADECGFFIYVTMVAREVGVETCRRHVGMEFMLVNRNSKPVKEILDELVDMYETKVNNTIADAKERAKALKMKNVFALSRYFELALKGTITWSKQLGSGVERLSYEKQTIAYANISTKIESLVTYCDFTVYGDSASQLGFNAYCVNAYVTPEYVIPRGNSPIREVPFYSAWTDWLHDNPNVYSQLVANDVIPNGFIPWSCRYMEEQFKQRPFERFDDMDSLYYYYDSALQEVNEWDPNTDFHHVTHPIDYMYPGLCKDEDNVTLLAVPRSGKPVVRLGVVRQITLSDYQDKLLPSEETLDPDQYIRPYRGLSAEAFMLLGESAFERIPNMDRTCVTVMGASDSIYLPDTKQVMHFTRLNELLNGNYAIENLHGRIYLIRATDGKLWEARI